FHLNFYVDEPKQPIDGDVYMNGVFYASTREGTLTLSEEDVSAGVINFVGLYHSRRFNHTRSISEENLLKNYMDFNVDSRHLNSYTLYFYINETKEKLDGDVYLNNKYLGKSTGGVLLLSVYELFPGTLTINATYGGETFGFQSDFTRKHLGYYSTDFVLPQDKLRDLLFDASSLDVEGIESAVFDYANRERKKEGVGLLRWNDMVAEIARKHSKSMVEGGFHHSDIEGNVVGDRLKDADVFYIVSGENLFSTGSLDSGVGEADVAELAVESWLKSPGHRSVLLDRDGLYSDAGVGVHCEEKYCYVTMDFIGLQQSHDVALEAGYCSFYWIYNPSYPFDFTVPVRLKLSASERLDVYVVSDRSEFDDCIGRKRIDSVHEYKHTKRIDEVFKAKQGYSLVLEADRDTEVSILLDYSTGVCLT
ncbi:MAG: CAP domain-containing protein, partial [Candidatus Altiarchaeota archaeon]|nr:CAP domain-containing protein [Candidatus Altiarchaeota archaeon]